MKSSFGYLRFGIFFLILIFLLKFERDFYKTLRLFILISIITVLSDSLIQFFTGYNVLGYEKDSRLSSFFGDEKILGSFMIKLTPIFISLYFIDKKKIKIDLTIFLVLLFSLILILLSAERSALGLFILYIILLSSILVKNKKKIILISIFLLTIITIPILTIDKLKNRYFLILKDQLVQINDQGNIDDIYMFTQAHDYMFKTAINIFKSKPLTGYGTKTFREKCNNEKFKHLNHKHACNTHPHNYYFQMLSENGIIGFLFLVSLYLIFIKDYIYNLIVGTKNSQLFNLSVISNLVILWPLIPHGNFFNNWLSIFIYLNLGIYLYFKENYKFIKK